MLKFSYSEQPSKYDHFLNTVDTLKDSIYKPFKIEILGSGIKQSDKKFVI